MTNPNNCDRAGRLPFGPESHDDIHEIGDYVFSHNLAEGIDVYVNRVDKKDRAIVDSDGKVLQNYSRKVGRGEHF